jgi:RHS repeat-associated protein
VYWRDGSLRQDKNRRIDEIRYNLLKLPRELVSFSGSRVVSYTYTATGQKLRMQEGPATGVSGTTSVRDYIGPFQYVNGVLTEISTDEGRWTPSGGYEYFIKDHLGNVRVAFGTGGIVQYSDYDPWGLALPALSGGSSTNRLKYNGKEAITEVGASVYDYGARLYDAQIGRWGVPDPLAELSRRFSPFVYGNNNPVRFIDPDGMNVEDFGFLYDHYSRAGLDYDNVSRSEIEAESGPGPKPKSKPAELTANGTQVMQPVSGLAGWFDQIWNGNRTYDDGRQVDSDGILTPYYKPITGMPPDISPGGLGAITKIGNSSRCILGIHSWSSSQLSQTAKEILNGKTAINVSSRAQAEELFLGLFQGRGFKNTTGMSAKEAKDFFGKAGTYHWDDAVDGSGQLLNHSATNAHGAMKHLQVHNESGTILRIFFGN